VEIESKREETHLHKAGFRTTADTAERGYVFFPLTARFFSGILTGRVKIAAA
jgi:hypothetical protein